MAQSFARTLEDFFFNLRSKIPSTQNIYYFFDDIGFALTRRLYAKKTFVLFGALIGLSVGLGMLYAGYALLPAAIYSFSAFLASALPTLYFFSDLPTWIDDLREPPVPVTIVAEKNEAKEAENLEIVKQLMQAKELPDADIANIKAELKKLFNLRSYNPISALELEERWEDFHERYDALQNDIHCSSCWANPEKLQLMKKLAIEAVILSDALCARMEHYIQSDNKQVTTETVSGALKNQQQRYCRNFLYGAIIDLYHFTRGKMVLKGNLGVVSSAGDIDETRKLPEFYEKGTPQNDIRKIYNTFIKHGFYQRYGNKAFRRQLLKDDQRFEHWTQTDSKKKRNFRAYPDTRPT